MSSICPTVWIVSPCYNEEEVLRITAPRMIEKINSLQEQRVISEFSSVLLVDDGSSDNTWRIIEELCESDPRFKGLKLAHNRGHQNALYAGLIEAKDYCDYSFSIDADLQDDVNVLDKMLEEAQAGAEIIFGVREARSTDTFFKRNTAKGFYSVMQHLGADTIPNHADCRLMSKRAMEALSEYEERNLFLRGLAVDLGFKTAIATYDRSKREAGESKYPLKKMLAFAWQGITSFSTKPLKMITRLGFSVFIIGIALLIYTLVQFFRGVTVEGWASLSVSIWIIGGLVMLSIGVLGEYIGKIYDEVKRRPRYFPEKTTWK
ncbi:glycosyltransferase [Boudabousia liubingyangii]|uniref:glycosyltransferase family 2 protein n=1 Tax=Boudabousia liubingyangii TaxID=1921764 RepID=UPI00093BDA87|nr:glycosyltransferase family 2 protein [Boudabousia liubingyangii]OKL48308.1 glycosyltransferase [Boudabousia liubingyangii]